MYIFYDSKIELEIILKKFTSSYLIEIRIFKAIEKHSMEIG